MNSRTALLGLLAVLILAVLHSAGVPWGELVLAVAAGVIVLLALRGLWRLVGWLARPESRRCPHCGCPVPNGSFVCGACGFDFRQGARYGEGT